MYWLVILGLLWDPDVAVSVVFFARLLNCWWILGHGAASVLHCKSMGKAVQASFDTYYHLFGDKLRPAQKIAGSRGTNVASRESPGKLTLAWHDDYQIQRLGPSHVSYAQHHLLLISVPSTGSASPKFTIVQSTSATKQLLTSAFQ